MKSFLCLLGIMAAAFNLSSCNAEKYTLTGRCEEWKMPEDGIVYLFVLDLSKNDMENVLDLLRKEQLKVSSDIVDKLFKCIDALEQNVESVGEGGPEDVADVTDLVASLSAIVKAVENKIGSANLPEVMYHGEMIKVNPVGYQNVLYVTLALYIVSLCLSLFLVKPTKKEKVVAKSDDTSTVKRLGQWVKKAVNCCIE